MLAPIVHLGKSPIACSAVRGLSARLCEARYPRVRALGMYAPLPRGGLAMDLRSFESLSKRWWDVLKADCSGCFARAIFRSRERSGARRPTHHCIRATNSFGPEIERCEPFVRLFGSSAHVHPIVCGLDEQHALLKLRKLCAQRDGSRAFFIGGGERQWRDGMRV